MAAAALMLVGALARPVAHAENGRWVFVVRFFVVEHGGRPIVGTHWIEAALMVANRVFGPADVRFVDDGRLPLDERYTHIASREQLIDLGRFVDGRHIDVFVVETIPEMDDDDSHCLGVTRSPRYSRSPYIVLSTRRLGAVLAHELGHYFGNEHQGDTVMAPFYSSRPLLFDLGQTRRTTQEAERLHRRLSRGADAPASADP